jgi:hypothetical protein
MPAYETNDTRVRSPQPAGGLIDCPDCGPGMPARALIREADSGVMIVACLGCRKLYLVHGVDWRLGPGA